MNMKIKSIVIILSTFIIGIIFGIVIRSAFIPPPHKQIEELRKRGGIVDRIEKRLGLTESQAEILKPVIREYGEKLYMLAEKNREEIFSTIDSMYAKMKPILREEQIERLDREFERMKRMPPPPPRERR